ncbi:MAG: N-acetylmuramoyl-L-alanine amidase CwlD [Candidatus Reconcilbacillus cellulovorans]|uniref:N-acetylmuramoyl-L-alanine amidase CwlD n=1 Tax=Candidatus Reconcilbacillus cellulovorans TaxID=1906605 RepID=A0A2A6E2T5_9BACL|nr:MAG: N-acetylmuramoyl-L-alanine amidase CwlD [Candidatus Reconcilbacillus cellulovorans]
MAGGKRRRLVVWLRPRGALKLAACVAAVGLLALLLADRFHAARMWKPWGLPLAGKVLAVDAGHGGPDGGAESREGLVEKDIALSVALYLRDYLQQAGAVVVMTREEDIDLADPGTSGLSRRKTEDLLARVRLVESSGADMLVSVHLNSTPSARWRGAQVFYHRTNAQAARLAACIQAELRRALGNTDREALPVETKFLLKALRIPGVIVEAGFLSNPEEARLLADPVYQRKMAEAVYRGVLRYAVETKNE